MNSKPDVLPQSSIDLGRPARIVGSDELFAGERELGILHAGALYRLTMTRQGKLILTK